MRPLTRLLDRIETALSKRTLARVTVALSLALVGTLAFVGWYVASVGVSMEAVAADGDDRTVVIDAEDRRAFARNYDPDREVGWCLYGSANDTHVRIDAVVPSGASGESDRIAFTCLPETAGQVLGNGSAALIGAVHSHPHFDESYLSRADMSLFGRASPFVSVMGVYTAADGVAFFTESSLVDPLAVRVVGGGEPSSSGDGASAVAPSNRTETP